MQGVRQNGRNKAKPNVALPRADKFGDVVTIYLKEYNRQDTDKRFIYYLLEMFSRLMVAKFVPYKEPHNIVKSTETVLSCL